MKLTLFLSIEKGEKRKKSLTFFAFSPFSHYNLEENLFVEFVSYEQKENVWKKTTSSDET